MTLKLKSLKREALEALEADQWTIETLAVATVNELVIYKGIGRVGAANAITEAAGLINDRGLTDADELATEHYYQKATPAKILKDWEDAGLPTKNVALTSARALAALKGIDEALALRLISVAQDVVNRQGLYESGSIGAIGVTRQNNSAFDEKWLSGEVEPPPMAIRVKRIFERTRDEYEAANG